MRPLIVALILTASCFAATAATAATAPTPEDRAQSFFALLAKEDYPAAFATFDSPMAKAVPRDNLAALWKGLLFQHGAFKQIKIAKTVTRGDATVVALSAEFARATASVVLTVNKDGTIGGLWFGPAMPIDAAIPPPPYADKNAFTESEVKIGPPTASLPGTLALPKGAGPFPAIVLVHGSGPNDRDETIGPNKPFRDIAWGLASRGIAVLRYDKRTRVYPLDVHTLTVNLETVDDALAAAKLLTRTKAINPDRIFILGHSLGGMMIPRIAQNFPQARGFIILAGTTRPLEDVVIEQVRYIFSLEGNIGPEKQKILDDFTAQAARVKDPKLSPETLKTDLLFGTGAPYWLDLRAYNPPAEAKKIKSPLLILQGARDYQVTLTDYKRWQDALQDRPDVQFKLYPRGNHLLIDNDGPCTPAEYEKQSHIPELIIQDLKTWIDEQSAKK